LVEAVFLFAPLPAALREHLLCRGLADRRPLVADDRTERLGSRPQTMIRPWRTVGIWYVSEPNSRDKHTVIAMRELSRAP
jgi:hypothetical protein